MTNLSASTPILLNDEDVDAELDRLYALKLEPEATASLQEICDMIEIESLMSEGEHPFASDQILRHINEYLSKTYGQGEYDTLLTAAYLAGLYNDESTAKEIFRHVLKFIGQVGFVRSQRELLDLSDSELECTPKGCDHLKLFADFNLRETEMVVQTADWTLAAGVITNEQYADIIRKIYVEGLDLDPSAFIRTIILDFNGEKEYELKHVVTKDKLGALYVKIRRSWYLYDSDSETRKLARALAQARAGAEVTLSKAEEGADDEPTTTTIEKSSLGNIDSCNNGNRVKFGEKEGWVTGADSMPKNDEENIIEMISCDETETEKTITKVGFSNSQLGGGTKRGGSIQIMNASEEGNADGGRNGGGDGEDFDQRSGGLTITRDMGSFNGLTDSILTIVIVMLMNWLLGMIPILTALDAKEDCLLSAYGHFWKLILIGLVGFVFLAGVTVLSRNGTMSVKSSRKKRIKTLASIHCGRKNFSILLRIAVYFLLVDTDTAQAKNSWDSPPLSYFGWTTNKNLELGTNLDYKDYCHTEGFQGRNAYRSCLCERDGKSISPSYNEKPSYFVCNNDCHSGYPVKIEGFCAQCRAGEFFGHRFPAGTYPDYLDTSEVCPDHEDNHCACSVTSQSSDGSNKKWYFEYVCNHSAASYAHPANWVRYTSFPDRTDNDRYKAECSNCPAGTYSEQGDMVCTSCEEGTYASKDGMPKCEDCPPGQYSDGKGFTYCKVCPAGYYSNEEEKQYGSTGCTACPAGYYAKYPGSSTCTECPTGHYNSDEGADACKAAKAGYYVGETAENSLREHEYECPIGSYNSFSGQAWCRSCPLNKSTNETGSTSLSDCISCPYGVDPHTFACLKEKLNDNVCWDAGQVLSMDASTAIENLYSRVYNLTDVGINALISDAMGVIRGAAEGTSTIEDIETVLDKLKNASENWLVGLSDNFDSCVASTVNKLMGAANEVQHQYSGSNLLEYQFGYAPYRAEWIAHWQCKGATFGCTSFDTTGCPQAQTCFDPIYQYFASLLSFGGGTFFGNYQKLNTGRYTPEYSPSFIAGQLKDNVNSLVQWNNAATSFQRFYTLMDDIKDSKEFTANAIAAAFQVQAVSTSVSLNSSYTVGNLYYQQAVYNYNQTFQIAQIVQWGPAYCPPGYEITSEEIPNNCTDYETLVQECNKDIAWDAFLKLLTDTMKLAAGLVQPLPGTATKAEIALFKGFNSIANMVTGSTNLLGAGWYHSPWDPNTEMPPLPPPPHGSFADEQYAGGSYEWYLEGQKSLSESLKVWSPARWDAIYLENKKKYDPVLLNPPPCDQKTKIVTALNDYLLNVQSMTNYGSSMTAAEMSLVPVMGNIAAGIATEALIISANEQISGMVNKPNPSIGDTAPSEYQGAYETLFFTPYEDTSKRILAYGPSSSLAQQQYIAAKSIYGFCMSYSYMNAGLDYVDTSSGNKANCKEFGDLYLPTYETFNETVSSFANGTAPSSVESPPTSVDDLNKNIVDFAANVQGNPEALGQTRAEVGDNVETFTLEFAYDPNATTAYYGNLTEGKIRFTLTPSSSLLLKGLVHRFGVYDANPRVINVQTYWRGVTSNQFLKTTVNPISPYMVYPDPTGEGITFTLPPYSSAGTPSSLDSVYFAQFRSIQDSCATDDTSVDTKWENGEELQFCTPYSSELKQPFSGIASYAFLFPSMWATWEVEADQDQWNNRFFYDIDESKLALQIVFRHVASSTASPKGPNDCAQKCAYTYMSDDDTFVQPPLPGEAWCGRNSCNDCPAFHSYNGTQLVNDPFCRCNVWDGNYETCIPSARLFHTSGGGTRFY